MVLLKCDVNPTAVSVTGIISTYNWKLLKLVLFGIDKLIKLWVPEAFSIGTVAGTWSWQLTSI